MVRYDVKKKKKILIQTQHWSDKRKWCKETKTSDFQQPNMIYIWLKQISGQKTEERHYFQHWVDQYKLHLSIITSHYAKSQTPIKIHHPKNLYYNEEQI